MFKFRPNGADAFSDKLSYRKRLYEKQRRINISTFSTLHSTPHFANTMLSAGGIYAIPPPRTNLISPKIIAIAHIAIPAFAFPLGSASFLVYATMLIISPKIAKGILNQLNAPRQGINPKNIPHIDKIPITKLAVFINF
jgi:hypothetical protein